MHWGGLGWKAQAKAASTVRVRVGFQVGFQFQTKKRKPFSNHDIVWLANLPFAKKSDALGALQHCCNTAATPLQHRCNNMYLEHRPAVMPQTLDSAVSAGPFE